MPLSNGSTLSYPTCKVSQASSPVSQFKKLTFRIIAVELFPPPRIPVPFSAEPRTQPLAETLEAQSPPSAEATTQTPIQGHDVVMDRRTML